MAIQEKSSGHTYLCTIQIEVVPAHVENIPLRLHSDVNFLGQISMEDNHSFSCDVDYGNKDPILSTLFEKHLNYTIDLFSLDDGQRAPAGRTTKHGNSIYVEKDFFNPE